MPDVRRGMAAIEEAATRKGGSGNFRPFVPELRWKEDGETKHILVLTPIDEVATLDLHEWIPVGTFEKKNGEEQTIWETFLSRKDPFVGESFDKIADELDRPAKTRCVGVAVELEPVMEVVGGRKKPTSFSVKTDTYTRKTDDGEVEVTQPVIGLISQSSYLVWSPLMSYDESQGPLIELPLQMTRRGTDANTRYDFVAFPEKDVDLSPIMEYVEGISYFGDDIEDVQAAIAATDNYVEAAQAVADALLNKRIAELADEDRYNELVGPIESLPAAFGGKGGAAKKAKKAPAKRAPRPSQAKEKVAAEAPVEPEVPAENASQDDRFALLKARFEG